MKYCAKIADGIDVQPTLRQLARHPELWGKKAARIDVKDSPHAQTQDIWLRFRDEKELTSPEKYGEPHFATFWPAWYALPGLHPIVYDVMAMVQAVYLGGILMTKILPGKAVLPHIDHGWHPTFNNTKAYVIFKANERCINQFPGEKVIMRPGDVWLFNNQVVHSVENDGDDERIAMVITMRVER